MQLTSLGRKLAYAVKYREPNLLLSDAIKSESRLMYVREPRERVQKVAPFLELDSDPYPAAVNGRIVWIVDGYTTSAGYPYSQRTVLGNATADSLAPSRLPQEEVNYIRNSVKATVDAYDGTVTLYEFGDADPVLQSWNKAFGGDLLKKESEISPELRAHLRYPEDLFKVQRQLLTRYHVTDAQGFFSREDFWEVPADPAEALNGATNAATTPTQPGAAQAPVIDPNANGPDQPPFYSLLQFPGQPARRFQLSTSFTGLNRPNLAAFASVSSDPEDYGTIRVLQTPRSGTPPNGPGQVANQFVSEQAVASALLPFRQNSAQVIFGNLLTLPAGGGLLYVQPVFVRAQGGESFPTLQRVLVSYGNEVAANTTLARSLADLFGAAPPTPPAGTPAPGAPPSPGATPVPSPSGPPASVAALVTRIVREGEALTKSSGKRKPIAVKIAPDLDDSMVGDVVSAIIDAGADAIISSNTTISRDGVAGHAYAAETGGLSGAPLTKRADAMLAKVVKAAATRVPIIGVGGIMSVADAKRKIDIGASLIQIYTGMLYRGPGFVGELVRGLHQK